MRLKTKLPQSQELLGVSSAASHAEMTSRVLANIASGVESKIFNTVDETNDT